MKAKLQPEPGTYILVLKVNKSREIKIGKIGTYKIDNGFYIYVGSAHGPGGIKARIERHLKRYKTRHWHIDYLRNTASIVAILFNYSKRKKECEWVSKLNTLSFLTRPIRGFGSSDCSCLSHLFFCKQVFSINSLRGIDQEPIDLLILG